MNAMESSYAPIFIHGGSKNMIFFKELVRQPVLRISSSYRIIYFETVILLSTLMILDYKFIRCNSSKISWETSLNLDNFSSHVK